MLTYRPEIAGKTFALALAEMLRAEMMRFPLEPASGEFAWLSHAHHHVKIGVAFQHTTFESLSGIDLEQLAIGGSFPRSAAIRLSATITRFSVRYTPSRWVGIGALVPVVRTSVQGESARTVLVPSNPPTMLNQITLRDAVDQSATGLGDIVIRGRVNIIAKPRNETGVQIDVNLPIGNKEELLGRGTRQTRVMFVNSSAFGPVAAHVNAGYTFGGEGIASVFPARVDPRTLVTPSDEWNYAAGLEASVAPRVTINGDVVGRRLMNSARFSFRPFPNGSGIYVFESGSVDSVYGLVGATIKASNVWFVTGRMFFSLKADALKPQPSIVIGMETGF